jgi:alpha-N-arabinofuranosidase
MPTLAQLVNVIAPIFTNETGYFKQTIYYPLQLFAQNVHGASLDLFVDCETYKTEEFFIGLGESTTKQDKVPYLDVSASYLNDVVVINVVNRHKDKALSTDIISQSGNFEGDVQVLEVNGADTKVANDFGKTLVETKSKQALKAKGNLLTYSFPPHSFTQLKAKIKK